jgi:uncharacterized protein (TIGR02145 family)/prepilin-type N-terminal cleavage/methylation domain-containing protein
MKSKKAFTLIELLVVIAIIGILATISVIALQNARAKSRDAKRAGDIKQVQTALELFFNDKNRYPTAAEWNAGQIYSTSTAGTSTYMQVIPSAPAPADGSCSSGGNSFSYRSESDSTYTISFCLGNTTGTLSAGKKCATPGGILDESCCSGSVSYGGEVYDVVEVGDQCWLDRNLNVGTMVSGVTEQTDNDIIEKYCLSDTSSNCDDRGGIYQWDEVMGYVETEGAQGICPTGWHVPTDAEYDTLISYVGANGFSGTEATALKEAIIWWGGTGTDDFGFTLIPNGQRELDGSFYAGGGAGQFTLLWSSSLDGSSAWYRIVYRDYSWVTRGSADHGYGDSVRCLKD